MLFVPIAPDIEGIARRARSYNADRWKFLVPVAPNIKSIARRTRSYDADRGKLSMDDAARRQSSRRVMTCAASVSGVALVVCSASSGDSGAS